MAQKIYKFCVSKNSPIAFIKRLIEYWNKPKPNVMNEDDKDLEKFGKQIVNHAKSRCKMYENFY